MLLAALLVAVTALTGVGFFTDRIAQAVDQRAAEVLAADLRLRSRRAGTVGVRGARGGAGHRRRRASISFPSVVFFGGGLRAHRGARGRTRLSAARPAEDRRRALRARARDGRAAGARRDLARFAPARAARRARGRLRQHRCVRVHGDAACSTTGPTRVRPSSTSRPRCSFRSRTWPRPSSSAPAAARRTRCCSRAGRRTIREFRRAAGRAQGAGRAPGRRGRGEPADPVFDAARGAVPEPFRHDHRAARGRRGRDGGAALYAAPPRQRRAHEVHGRAAAPRAAGDGHRARPDRADRGARRRRSRLARAGAADAPARRPRRHRPAAADAGARAPGRRDRARDPGRIRAAADAAAEARAARARTAPKPRAAAAALLDFLRACGRRAARRAVLAGARRAPGRLPGRGHRRRRSPYSTAPASCSSRSPGGCAARSASPGATASRTSRAAGARASCRWSPSASG